MEASSWGNEGNMGEVKMKERRVRQAQIRRGRQDRQLWLSGRVKPHNTARQVRQARQIRPNTSSNVPSQWSPSVSTTQNA